jgi:hypothetical protein
VHMRSCPSHVLARFARLNEQYRNTNFHVFSYFTKSNAPFEHPLTLEKGSDFLREMRSFRKLSTEIRLKCDGFTLEHLSEQRNLQFSVTSNS